GDPVERRGREDDVDDVATEVEADEVRDAQVDPVAEPVARRLDHRRRHVDADHATVGDALDQQFGEAARAAAGVEYGLVASKLEAFHDLPAEALHRRGEPVVRRTVPATCLGHGRTLSRTTVCRYVFLRPKSRAIRAPSPEKNEEDPSLGFAACGTGGSGRPGG